MDYDDDNERICYSIEPGGVLKTTKNTTFLRVALAGMVKDNVERPLFIVSEKKRRVCDI